MRNLIFLGLICLVIVGACSSKSLTLREAADQDTQRIGDAIRKNVEDPDRSAALLQVQSRIQVKTTALFDELTEVRSEWADLNENYDATPEDFELLTRQTATARRAAVSDMIRLAMEARSVATAEDWAAMSKTLKEEK